MDLPWWPIVVAVEPEREGLRITSPAGGGVAPEGSLVRWDRLSGVSPSGLWPLRREPTRVGGRRVVLGLRSRRVCRRARAMATEWFADPSNAFCVRMDPAARRERVVSAWSMAWLCGSLAALFGLRVVRWVPDFSTEPAIGVRAWVVEAVVIGLLALACGVSAVASVWWARRTRRAWWVEEVTGHGLVVADGRECGAVAWDDVVGVREGWNARVVRLRDGRRCLMPLGGMPAVAVVARVGVERPWLTPAFVLWMPLVVTTPLWMGWVTRWLGVPVDTAALWWATGALALVIGPALVLGRRGAGRRVW